MRGRCEPRRRRTSGRQRFGEAIVELADEEWELTTHPDDWTVITTVAWVVVGDAQLSAAAAGQALRQWGSSMRPSSAGIPSRLARHGGGRHRQLRDIDPTSTIVPHEQGPLLGDLLAQRIGENWFGRGISGRPRAVRSSCPRILSRAPPTSGPSMPTPCWPRESCRSAGCASGRCLDRRRFLALMGRGA